MAEDFPRGRFVWHDLMTHDPEAAVDFYGRVVGWTTTPFPGMEEPYLMWTKEDGTTIGGSGRLPEGAGAPPHWLAYVAVPDVDASAERAGELGGQTVHPPTDIPNVGRFAVIADPQGAMIAIYTPGGDAPGHDGAPQVGEFSWHELMTTDHEAAFDFYADLFGWQKTEAMDMGEAGTYQMYGRTERSLGGMMNQPAEMPGPPAWLHYVKVDDVNRKVEVVRELGGQALNGPMEVPGGDLIAQCLDPQGAAFAIHSTASGG